jgi:ATP-dependent helicase/nuclease subunit A
MLTVYKASAGSGKTFQLVAEYLKLLIENQLSYRNILAVTFTNKATNEMKSRILEQLYLLSTGKDTAYLKILTGATKFNEQQIRGKAQQALKNILHDYHRFSISTIDSFTQRVIKAFNREMGISPNFMLELDSEMVLAEAVDRLMEKISDDKKLRNWLVKFSEEKIRDGSSMRIEENIKKLGSELFKEKFQLFFPDENQEKNPYNRQNLEKFITELMKSKALLNNAIQTKAGDGMDTIHQQGFSVDDFSYKSSGVAGYLEKTANGNIAAPSNRTLKAAQSAEVWVSKSHKQKDAIQILADSYLQPKLLQILDLLKKYFSVSVVLKHIRILGILTDLKEEIRLHLKDKEMLQLADSNLLLSKIIGNSESPFVYEKIGVRYNYYMLDEFQDTSSLQWQNFKPLILNALSEGYPTLLVGDVKQAIYRWRNSDWNILASQVQSDFPNFKPKEISLEKNWRSRLKIIDFNNHVIGAVLQSFEDRLINQLEDNRLLMKFRSVYQDYIQKPGNPSAKTDGYAEIQFFPKEDFEENSMNLLIEQVKILQERGLKASEIAILIRKNSEGAAIIGAFLEASRKEENADYNLSVLSGESLFLYASQGVNLVMLVIELLVDPENILSKTALLHLWHSWLKPTLENDGTAVKSEHKPTNILQVIPEQNDRPGGKERLYETDFEAELFEKIAHIRQKVLLSSLDEIVMEICSVFNLFRLETELPFLQTLIDTAAELKITLSNDLSNMLHWWNEKGFKTSVSANDEVDSVRLMTIHKAKGLEFEAVLIPFFNWNVSWGGNQQPLLWCSTDEKPMNQLPLLPVEASNEVKETIFKNDFLEEKLNSYIDTLNLVYVAFTRAKSVLLVNSIIKEEKSASFSTISAILYDALTTHIPEKMVSFEKSGEKELFSYGEMPLFNKSDESSGTIWIEKYHFNAPGERIRLRINSENFLEDAEHNRSVKNSGKLIHEILAGVKTSDDILPECNNALKEGKITETEHELILEKMKKAMLNPVIKHWFSGNLQVMNERNLITKNKVIRPDRIMFSGKNAVVVDYKWGEKIPEKHYRQVREYTETLRECGFEKVEGYIWYLNQDELEKING